MDVFLVPLLTILSTNNIPLAAALLFCVLVIVDRRRILQDYRRREDRIDHIVDEALKGQVTVASALEALKSVLFEIRGKL